jgi:hypothetical protein
VRLLLLLLRVVEVRAARAPEVHRVRGAQVGLRLRSWRRGSSRQRCGVHMQHLRCVLRVAPVLLVLRRGISDVAADGLRGLRGWCHAGGGCE